MKSLVIPIIWLVLTSVIYSRITLQFFAINHICSKWPHSCSKEHHFCFKSHHFCSHIASFLSHRKNEMWSHFVSPFQRDLLLDQYYNRTDWILWIFRFQNGCTKVVIELRDVQLLTCGFKSSSPRCGFVQFLNHAYDFRSNCTPLSLITVINHFCVWVGWKSSGDINLC